MGRRPQTTSCQASRTPHYIGLMNSARRFKRTKGLATFTQLDKVKRVTWLWHFLAFWRKASKPRLSPRCTCFPPRATSAQVHRSQVQVQLGFASLYLDLALVDLSGVFGGHLVQLQLKSTAVKSRYNSASPRCTWTWPWWTWAESAVYYLVQLQLR